MRCAAAAESSRSSDRFAAKSVHHLVLLHHVVQAANTKAGQEQKKERLKEKQGEERYDSDKMKEAMSVTGDAETPTPRSALLTNAAAPVLLALDRSSFGNAANCGCQRTPCATHASASPMSPSPQENRTAVSNRFTARDPLAPHFSSTITTVTNLPVPKTRRTDN